MQNKDFVLVVKFREAFESNLKDSCRLHSSDEAKSIERERFFFNIKIYQSIRVIEKLQPFESHEFIDNGLY